LGIFNVTLYVAFATTLLPLIALRTLGRHLVGHGLALGGRMQMGNAAIDNGK